MEAHVCTLPGTLRETFSTFVSALEVIGKAHGCNLLGTKAVAAGGFLHTFVSALEVVGEAHLCTISCTPGSCCGRLSLHTFVSALEVVGEAHLCTISGTPGSCCGRLSLSTHL
jgi:hypothetical protein